MVAAGAYLDARYHISKDLISQYYEYKTERIAQKASEFCSLEPRLPAASDRKCQLLAVAERRLNPYALLETQAKSVPPQHEALWSRDASYTYPDFLANINRYAQLYLSLGLRPGDVVSCYLTNTPEILICTYACWAIGCHPSFINYNVSGEALLHCLGLGDSKLLLVDEAPVCQDRVNELRSKISESGNQIVVLNQQKKSEIAAIPPSRPGDEYRAHVGFGSTACLIFTSGTTGLPKACLFEMSRFYKSNIGRGGLFFTAAHGIHSRWYNCMPLYHGTGMIAATGALANGATVCIGKRFRVSTFWSDVLDSQATGFVYVGEVARYLVAQPESPRDREHKLKAAFGNGLRPDVWKTFQDRFGIETIFEFFSSTEGMLTLHVQSRGDFLATAVGHQGALERFLTRNVVTAALTDAENSKNLLKDEQGRCIKTPLATGGEILIAVPGRGLESGFAGYMKNKKASDERFAADVFRPGDLFYRSGDALKRDDDGRWFFLDRLGDTFRWKSENVSTAEVAVVVGEFSGVHEANVYGVLVPNHDGRAGCAALYIEGGPANVGGFDWKGLAKHCRAKLPRYAVPIFIRVLEGEMHGTHNHKQNKVPLREQGIEPNKISSGDRMLWLPPDSDRYVEFGKGNWGGITSKQARL